MITSYKVTLRNRIGSSMLMNSPKAMIEASDDPGGVTTKKKYDDEEEAKIRLYETDKGELYIPSVAFRASLLNGCKGRRIGKKAATTVVSGAVFCVGDKCILTDPDTGKTLMAGKSSKDGDYKLHKTRAVVGRAAVPRVRPEIENWQAEVEFEIDTDFVSDTMINDLLDIAGRVAGILDWRPEKKGPHGRYQVVEK